MGVKNKGAFRPPSPGAADRQKMLMALNTVSSSPTGRQSFTANLRLKPWRLCQLADTFS